jgi:alkylation response protein AidB-like acyl-CoA dehydrogenase
MNEPLAREGAGASGSGTVEPLAVEPPLLETLAAHAGASERERRLADRSVAAMREAGLLRALVPRRAGGPEIDFRTALGVVRASASGDSAAAWVLMVSISHDWMVGSFPERAQDEVFADLDGVPAGSLAPSGTLERVAGGWLVSGRWPFVSGADHARWYLLGTADHTAERPRLHHLVVPREDVELIDDWHSLGLRGTGSVDLVAERVFVPEHRTIDSGTLLGGRSEWSARHATRLYRIPILPGLTAMAATAVLGIAVPAFDAAVALILEQKDRYTGKPKVDRPGLHARLAEARNEIRCADLLLERAADLLEQAASGADAPALRADARFQASYAAELCRRAIDRLMAATGARSAFDSSPLQRAFRDLTMAAKHQMLNFDDASLAFGRTLVGLDLKGFVL